MEEVGKVIKMVYINSMQHKFFGSKLNTALLLILIILMVIAIRFMYKNKEVYLPILSQKEQVGQNINNIENNIITNEITENSTGNWKIGGDEIVTFLYPPDWKIMRPEEPRPESVYNSGIWIVPPTFLEISDNYKTGDAIVILEYSVNYDRCKISRDILTRCEIVHSFPVFTQSINPEVLYVFDQLIKTIK